jgi:hypothetical protein
MVWVQTKILLSIMFYNPAFYPKAVGYKLTRQVFWLVLLNCSFPNFFSGFVQFVANNDKLTATGIAPALTGFPFNHFHEPNSKANLDRINWPIHFNYQRFVENYPTFYIFILNKAASK